MTEPEYYPILEVAHLDFEIYCRKVKGYATCPVTLDGLKSWYDYVELCDAIYYLQAKKAQKEKMLHPAEFYPEDAPTNPDD